MTSQQMTDQIHGELSHIPEGDYEFQGELRMLYNMVRRRSFGSNPEGFQTAGDVLRYCIAQIRQRHPNAEVHYDEAFFGLPSTAGV